MRTYWVGLLPWLILAASAVAQEEPTYSVAGRVTNSATGVPIRRALVQITDRSLPSSIGSRAETARTTTRATFTDDFGDFRFSGLPPGLCSVGASKPGFAADTVLSARREVKLGPSVEDVELQLSPLGAITGTVLDQDGRPVIGVRVLVFSLKADDGNLQIGSFRAWPTDDRGVYRASSLEPGSYYVKADIRAGEASMYISATMRKSPPHEGFAPVYFGGGSKYNSAKPVRLDPGATVRADFALTVLPAFKVRGSIGNYVNRRSAVFELVGADPDLLDWNSKVLLNGDTGEFEIQDVLPGAYTLRITQDQARAEVRLAVAGSDLDGVVARLSPAVDIPVLTQITDLTTSPGAKPRPVACEVSLQPLGNLLYSKVLMEGGLPFQPDRKISSVLPGAYRAAITCSGGYARYATAGSQNLLTSPVLSVQPGVSPLPIQIAVSPGGGKISGMVNEEVSSAGWMILLAPQFPQSTGPYAQRSYRRGGAGPAVFNFSNLAPGSYTLYALPEGTEVEYRNPAFLATLTGGVSVLVGDGETKEVTIGSSVR